MGITYFDLLYKYTNTNNPPEFKEDTNVICYYIIKTLFFWFINDFLIWSRKNHTTLLSISKTPNTIHSLCEWISQRSESPTFISAMQYKKKDAYMHLNKSLKMMHYT